MERLLVEKGLATAAEIESGRSLVPPAALPRKLTGGTVSPALAKGSPTEREPAAPALFAIGDSVRAKLMNPTGHTRLPRYVRGRTGRIARVHGAHVFPDSSAAGRGEDPRWLYSVAFAATEVWGPEARSGDEVVLDLWEPYLERP
jgi:nitrile hydratase beta subunit